MADRIDDSQYPDAVDFTGGEFDMALTVDAFPVRTEPSLDTPEAVDFTNYRGPSDIPDIMRAYPELFNTQPGRKTVQETRYRGIGNGTITAGKTFVLGFALRETSGVTPAVIRLRDGMDPSATIVLPISLAAGESRADYLPYDSGIRFTNGLYFEIVSGAVEGSVFTMGTYNE
jgi:hypothetical protein